MQVIKKYKIVRNLINTDKWSLLIFKKYLMRNYFQLTVTDCEQSHPFVLKTSHPSRIWLAVVQPVSRGGAPNKATHWKVVSKPLKSIAPQWFFQMR